MSLTNYFPPVRFGELTNGKNVDGPVDPGSAWEVTTARLATDYQQIAMPHFPTRPAGAPRLIVAGERVALFRCELLALLAVGGVSGFQHGSLQVIDEHGRRMLVSIGNLFDQIAAEVKVAMIEEAKAALAVQGFVLESDIEARQARQRHVARLTPAGDRLEIVK